MKSNFGRCAIFLGFKGFTIFFCFSFLLCPFFKLMNKPSHFVLSVSVDYVAQMLQSIKCDLLIWLIRFLSIFGFLLGLSLAQQLGERVPDASKEQRAEQVLEGHEGIVDAQEN